MWRCLNDIFGYCCSEPQREEHIVTEVYQDIAGRKTKVDHVEVICKNNPKTCSQFLTCAQQYERLLSASGVEKKTSKRATRVKK